MLNYRGILLLIEFYSFSVKNTVTKTGDAKNVHHSTCKMELLNLIITYVPIILGYDSISDHPAKNTATEMLISLPNWYLLNYSKL